MAQQTINVGTSPNDGTGTPLRTAFQYTNSNFSELYTAVGPSGNNIVVPGNATITGDLTVDTSTLKVDSANNRVGIGTASPTQVLTVRGNVLTTAAAGTDSYANVSTDGVQNSYLGFNNSGSTNAAGASNNNTYIGNGNNYGTQIVGNSNILASFGTTGVFNWYDGAGGTRMTLNSTGLGVGVTPSAWASGNKFIDINSSAAFGAFGSSDAMMIGNAYWNGSSWIRKTANNAWRFVIESVSSTPTMTWQLAANGSAGSSITWTQAMTLDASGNLLVGTTGAANARLDIVRSTVGSGIQMASKASGDVAEFGLRISKYDNDNTTTQRFIGFGINDDANGSGQINANGANQAAFGSYSDSRLKENIVSLTSQLQNILSLRPVEFDYKDGSGHQIGFVAQEIQQVYSDVVGESDGFLTVTGWSKTEARLVSAIKELAAKVQALEAKLA